MRISYQRPRARLTRRSGLLAGLTAAAFLLTGCASDAIFPTTGMPPAPPGPPPPYPSLVTPATHQPGEEPVLTETEVREAEARLGRLADDREAAVRRRIQDN